MTKTKELKEEEKGSIVALWSSGVKIAEIARRMNLSESTVRSFMKRYNARGTVKNAYRSGRPSKASIRDKRLLVRETIKNRRLPLSELTLNSGLEVSLQSTRNYLHEANIDCCKAAKKPFISKENQRKRLSWCKEQVEWGVLPEWGNIIWSDESSVEIGKSSRCELVWRRPGERYKMDCLRPTFKSGRKLVMVWGCFVGDRLGPLVVCEGPMKSEDYIEILNER